MNNDTDYIETDECLTDEEAFKRHYEKEIEARAILKKAQEK